MKRPVSIILTIVAFLTSFVCVAQTRVVKGVVLDRDGNPLPGAGVLVKEVSGVGVSADSEGRFEISVPEGARTLVFSSLGMEDEEYAIPVKISGGGRNNPVISAELS